MTFTLFALQDNPLGLFDMSEDSIDNRAGYSYAAQILNGPADVHMGIAKGMPSALVLNSGTTASFDTPLFQKGDEDDAFTLSAWVRASGPASEQQVLGNSGQMDGLLIDGTVVSFVIKYADASEARCTFDLQVSRAALLHGVYTGSKTALYVNGELVDEYVLSEEQRASQFNNSNLTFSSGATSGSQSVAVNGVAYYSSALEAARIWSQYRAGTSTPTNDSVPHFFGGNPVSVVVDTANTFLTHTWDDDEDWNGGLLANAAVVQDELVPQFDLDTSVEGHWFDAIALGVSELTSIHGVLLNWDGEGVVVSASLDGMTWETASRGRLLDLIVPGFDPTDQVLQLQVTFPGGIVEDGSYLASLSLVGITDDTSQETSGRTITYSQASPNWNRNPLELSDLWGTYVEGTITISADALESLPARTIELWIKRDGTNPAIDVVGTFYQNGVVATDTLPDGQWTLLHVVADADVTAPITITGPAQIGAVAIYDTALSDTQISQLYNTYLGANSLRVNDSSSLSLTQPGDSATIYAADWSIQGAG